MFCTLKSLLHNLEITLWAAKAAIDAGAIRSVIEAMEHHRNHSSVQKRGCLFLSNLAIVVHDKYRQKNLQAKCLVAAGEVLKQHERFVDKVTIRYLPLQKVNSFLICCFGCFWFL